MVSESYEKMPHIDGYRMLRGKATRSVSANTGKFRCGEFGKEFAHRVIISPDYLGFSLSNEPILYLQKSSSIAPSHLYHQRNETLFALKDQCLVKTLM